MNTEKVCIISALVATLVFFTSYIIFIYIKNETVEKTVEKILALIEENPNITQKVLAEETGLTRRGIEWNLKTLKDTGKLKRIGADRGGYWEIIKN